MRPEAQPEAKLALLCAGTAASRAASRSEAETLIESIDWRVVAEQLRPRRLLPLLGERIQATAGDQAPDWFVQATADAIEKSREQGAVIELLTIQVMDALRAGGIQSLALKGPMLGRAVYGKPGRRCSADIDLLVAREDLPRAVEVAKQLDFYDPEPPSRFAELPLLHYRLCHRSAGLPMLELHWRVHWYEQQFSRDLLFHSREQDRVSRRPTPTDELTSLLLFYARDGFVDLRLACDVAAWWDIFGPELESGAVGEMIARYPRLERVLLAATDVADRLVGVPSRELLGGRRPLERRVRLAGALANPDARGSAHHQHADAWLVDWLVTPNGGRRDCLRRQLQGPSGLPAQAPQRSRSLLAYLDRGARLLRLYSLSLLRLAWEQGPGTLGRRQSRSTA